MHIPLSGAGFVNNEAPTLMHMSIRPHTDTHTNRVASEAWTQTGKADQSITSLLQQSNKVIIRQRLADLERPGQSKAAVMWGPALTHVTVTQSGSSCCQGMEEWKEERYTDEKENTGKGVGQEPDKCVNPTSLVLITLTSFQEETQATAACKQTIFRIFTSNLYAIELKSYRTQ